MSVLASIGARLRPVGGALDRGLARWRWIGFAGLAAAYLASGLHLIAPGEVGLVMHWGRLIGDTNTGARGPGLIWIWPAPIQHLVRVPARREVAVEIEQFASPLSDDEDGDNGFAITGDQELVNLRLTAKFLVTEPAAFHRAGPTVAEQCRRLVTAATLRVVARSSVADVLQLRGSQASARGTDSAALGHEYAREANVPLGLSEQIRRDAQRELDRLSLGVSLTQIEIQSVGPLAAVRDAFEAIHTARIDQETTRHRAQAIADETLIDAQSLARQTIAEARGAAVAIEADAVGQVTLFEAAAATSEGPNSAANLARLRHAALRSVLTNCRRVYLAPSNAPAGQVRISIPHEKGGT